MILLQLQTINGLLLYINAAHIVAFWASEKAYNKGGTTIRTTTRGDDKIYEVKESPEIVALTIWEHETDDTEEEAVIE